MKTMCLNDLRTGDIVLSTKGSYGIVLKNTDRGDLIEWYYSKINNRSINKFRTFRCLTGNMRFCVFSYRENDRIIKVWRVNDVRKIGSMPIGADENFMDDVFPEFELIYDDTVKEVTMDEVEEKFGCKVKIKND